LKYCMTKDYATWHLIASHLLFSLMNQKKRTITIPSVISGMVFEILIELVTQKCDQRTPTIRTRALTSQPLLHSRKEVKSLTYLVGILILKQTIMTEWSG
jgi:hypothetical protein